MIGVKLELSQKSVDKAIKELEVFKELLKHGIDTAVDIMTDEGAEIANIAYGDFPVEAVPASGDGFGEISVDGDMPLIAEFGAGDATVTPTEVFENNTETEVFRGSYSLYEGTQEYWNTGEWHWGGRKEPFTEIPPHLGLYEAKKYIIEESTKIAQGVFGG